jgi:hypothetical protein
LSIESTRPGVLAPDGAELVDLGLGERGADLDVGRLVGVGAELAQRVDPGHAVVRDEVGDLGAADEAGHDLVVERPGPWGPVQKRSSWGVCGRPGGR